MPVSYIDQRLPTHYPGRPRKKREYKTTEINQLADRILSADRSNRRMVVLEMLYEFGILTEATLFRLVSERVEISDNINTFNRQLRMYQKDGLIVDAPFGVLKRVTRADLPTPETGSLRAYCLGPVGEEYVRRKGWGLETPAVPVVEEHMVHDLLCAEAMLRMRQLWREHPKNPGKVEVYGPREVAVWDAEKRTYIIAPDGLLKKYSLEGKLERAFLVEYQNVRALLQVKQKIKRYEEIADPKYQWLWSARWGVEEMPWVMVMYRQKSTLHHYEEQIAQRGEMASRFASTSIEVIWAGKLSITAID